MIFQHTWRAVVLGGKRQTRRPIKPGETAAPGEWVKISILTGNGETSRVRAKIMQINTPAGRLKWRVGSEYAVQPARTARGIARIKVLTLRRESAFEITETDARAEGFASRIEFLALWRSMHGDDCQEIWVIKFSLVSVNDFAVAKLVAT